MLVLLMGISIFFGSCSPEKRLSRLVKHHPELMKQDTIKYLDTFIKPEFCFDTAYLLNEKTDTITITKDRIITTIIHKNDSVYITQKIPGDTSVRELKIPYTPIINQTGHNLWNYVTWIFVGVSLLLIILLIFIISRIKTAR